MWPCVRGNKIQVVAADLVKRNNLARLAFETLKSNQLEVGRK
jgi:hypothetical protein